MIKASVESERGIFSVICGVMMVVMDLDSALYLSSEYKHVIDYHEVYLQEGL